jgi:hypothetical protein
MSFYKDWRRGDGLGRLQCQRSESSFKASVSSWKRRGYVGDLLWERKGRSQGDTWLSCGGGGRTQAGAAAPSWPVVAMADATL